MVLHKGYGIKFNPKFKQYHRSLGINSNMATLELVKGTLRTTFTFRPDEEIAKHIVCGGRSNDYTFINLHVSRI